MSLPGMGTMVRYHLSSGVDVPAVVLFTADEYNASIGSFYGITTPASNTVYLQTWQSSGSPGVGSIMPNVAEGSSVGQFSRLAMEAED